MDSSIAEDRRDQEADLYERFNGSRMVVVDVESYDSVVLEIWNGSKKVKTLEIEECEGVFRRGLEEE